MTSCARCLVDYESCAVPTAGWQGQLSLLRGGRRHCSHPSFIAYARSWRRSTCLACCFIQIWLVLLICSSKLPPRIIQMSTLLMHRSIDLVFKLATSSHAFNFCVNIIATSRPSQLCQRYLETCARYFDVALAPIVTMLLVCTRAFEQLTHDRVGYVIAYVVT